MLINAQADFNLIHLTKDSGAAVEADALPTFRVYGQSGVIGNGTAEYQDAKTITGGTATTPIVFTAPAHGFTIGMMVTVAGVVGLTGANGTWRVSDVESSSSFEAEGTVGGGAYVSGGQARATGLYKLPFNASLRAGLEVGKTYKVGIYYKISGVNKADETSFTVVA